MRTLLTRHPVALECTKIAELVTGAAAEVVIFDDQRVFIAASTAQEALFVPRPPTEAERRLVGGDPGAPAKSGSDRSWAFGLSVEGHLVASLSLVEATRSVVPDSLAPILRLLTGVLDELRTDGTGEFHERVLEGLRDTVVVLSPGLDVRWVNVGAVSLLGYNPIELVGRPVLDFLHPDDVEPALNAMVRITQGLEVNRLKVRLRSDRGSYIPVEVTGTDKTADPLLDGFVLSFRDDQFDSELELELERTQRLSSAIAEGLRDGLVATDRYGGVILANSVARSLFGVPADAAPSQIDLRSIAVVTIDGRAVDLLEPTPAPIRCMVAADRAVAYLDVFSTVASTTEGEELGRVLVFTDVTAEHRSAEELRSQALHDQLTGLPNRRQLEHKLDELLHRPSDGLVAACFVDIDGFKLVNDNYGHRVGDQVIRIAAERLARQLRLGDLLVRHGGDEFVALLTDADNESAVLAVAERIRRVLSEPYEVGAERFDLTASVGVALAAPSEFATDVMLQRADIALYEAKANGRNRVELFDDSLAKAVRDEQAQQRLLRDAIDDQRVAMYFQPLVDAKTERAAGFEALARIETGTGEVLSPVHFLDAMSRSSLMWELDRVAFRMSCDAARLLGALEPDAKPYIACNFSAVSLTHAGFVEFVETTVRRARIRPEQICVEITESAAFDGGERGIAALEQLATRGFQLALDDFGTGYSSLAHLRDLPISSVKVDRSFIRRLDVRGEDRSIVEAVVNLARDLDLGIVAEGVETSVQLDHARALGFETIQGWHYAEAMPLDRCLEYWSDVLDDAVRQSL